MVTRQQFMDKIYAIVGNPGHSRQVIDGALNIWDRLVKSEINQPLPVLPNPKKGEWEAKTAAINERESNGESAGDTLPKSKAPPVKNQLIIQTQSKTFPEIKIILWANGAIAVRPADATAESAANYSPDEQGEMLHLAMDHLSKQKGEQGEQTAKNDTKESASATGDIGKNEKHKPVSLNKYQVKMPSGREFLYTISDSGALTRKEVQAYIPTFRQGNIPMFNHDHITEMHDHIQEDKEKKPVDKITKAQLDAADAALDKIAKAREPRKWGQSQRGIFDPLNNVSRPAATQTPPAPSAPVPNLARSLRSSRVDTSGYTGQQLAALKVGCPVDHPNLNSMNLEQMKRVGTETQQKWAKDQAAKVGIHYGPKPGERIHSK